MTAALAIPELTVERALVLLAEARDVDEVKALRDKADALALYARKRRASLEVQNAAVEIGIWSMRRIGELTRDLEHAPSRAEKGRKGFRTPDAVGKKGVLRSVGLSKQEASLCEQLAGADVELIRKHIDGVRERALKLTKSGTLAAVSLLEGYDSDEWYTPPEVVEDVRRVLGGIDYDPASSEVAQRTVKAKRFATKEQSGLDAKAWKGRVFMNPPYSQPLCSKFVERFIAEHDAGRMGPSIVLLNASTDTTWWHSLAARFSVCFTRGRLAFLRADGKPVEGNRVGQVFFYTGGSREFRTVFEQAHGTVMEM